MTPIASDASESPHATKTGAAPGPVRRAWRVPAACALGLALVAASCSQLEPTVRRSEIVLPPRIEAVAVLPVDNADTSTMNGQDREFLRQQIRAQLDTHIQIKSFDQPPSQLPSVVVLKSKITTYRTEERQGEQVYLRTVDVSADFEIDYQASEDPPHSFHRAYSYQKIYLPGQQVAAELFDVQNAMIEFAQLVDAEFYPSTALDDFDPRTARDPDTGEEKPVRMLTLGNENALEKRYALAEKQWRLALYDPNNAEVPRLYKITRLTIGLLREEEVPENVLEILAELAEESPQEFVSFREMLREELGGPSKYENRIGDLSLYRAGLAHANLAATHLNLARLARAQRQLDLAEYHFAMAWAHTRNPDYLKSWQEIQESRRLMPAGLSANAAIRLYLSIAPPSTAVHLPGPFDEKVLPPSKLRIAGIQALIRRAGGIVPEPEAAPLPPVEVEVQPTPLEPLPAPQAAPPAAPAPASPPPAPQQQPAPPAGGAAPQTSAPAAPPQPQSLPPPQDVPLEAAPTR